MDVSTLLLAAVAAVLLAIALWRGPTVALAGLKAAGQTLWRNLLLMLLGFVVAGLAQVLIPKDLITRWLGNQSGFRGVLIGCVLGGLVPGAPYATFPLVATLYRAGASLGTVVGFVSAWSLWSVTRLPVEMALVDPKPALVRYAITFVVPPLAGLLANVVARYL
ncbi:MAG: permease [Anaerolineales bacterium]|nr:permease [Anaerolineales bacterium]